MKNNNVHRTRCSVIDNSSAAVAVSGNITLAPRRKNDWEIYLSARSENGCTIISTKYSTIGTYYSD